MELIKLKFRGKTLTNCIACETKKFAYLYIGDQIQAVYDKDKGQLSLYGEWYDDPDIVPNGESTGPKEKKVVAFANKYLGNVNNFYDLYMYVECGDITTYNYPYSDDDPY